MRHILFICGKNRRRSPTAEELFSGHTGIEVSSAGTAADSDCVVSGDLIEWADEIFVMERKHLGQLRSKFGPKLRNKKMVSLHIPDRYTFMQPELIEELNAKVLSRLRDDSNLLRSDG